jgi:hypothetical protein
VISNFEVELSGSLQVKRSTCLTEGYIVQSLRTFLKEKMLTKVASHGWFLCGKNALKCTYERLNVQKFSGVTPRTPNKEGRGREGEGIGEGREGRGVPFCDPRIMVTLLSAPSARALRGSRKLTPACPFQNFPTSENFFKNPVALNLYSC